MRLIPKIVASNGHFFDLVEVDGMEFLPDGQNRFSFLSTQMCSYTFMLALYEYLQLFTESEDSEI